MAALVSLAWLTALLPRLTVLAVPAQLALLALLSLLTGLALLPRLAVAVRGIIHAARQGLHLVAEALHLVERFLRILLLAIEGLLGLVQLIAQALHAIGDTAVVE